MDKDFVNYASNVLDEIEIKEYYSIVKDVIEHPEYQKRKKYEHHLESVFEHSVMVSINSYKVAKKKLLDYRVCAIAGLLHDFYSTPWREDSQKSLFKKHGFVHAKEAAVNADKYFKEYINEEIIHAIECHMWPLTLRSFPKTKEARIITKVDKLDSLKVFKQPKQLPMYLGILKKSN